MLLTKLHIPQPKENVVHRSALFEKLNEGLNRKLVLVSAPAGYGKTTLVVDWIYSKKLKSVWYSLDESDNIFTSFLSYLITGLQTIDKSIGETIQPLLKTAVNLSAEKITGILVNDLIQSNKMFVLVFDDFHYIHQKEIIQFINYFIRFLPDNLHITIITRSDPSIQLSKLRSKQQLIELRIDDLSFSAKDTNEFFYRTHNISLKEEDADFLQTKTEGWISGIHLAGISIKGQDNVSTFIQNLKGSSRYIMDYLLDEVLSVQDKHVKDFLLKTSILQRLCPDLCDHILCTTNSHEIVELLETNNMFIIPLDNERKWYRYHHLFSDLLRKRLIQSSSINIPELHTMASEWLINNDLVDEAIHHLLLAQNYEKAAELISQEMFKIWDDGNHYKFSPWLNSLPENILSQTPQLIILKAELAMTRWQIQDAEELLHSAETILNKIENDKIAPLISLSTSSKNYRGRILVNYALIASYHEKPKDIIRYVEEALEILSTDQLIWRNLAKMILSDAYFIIGKLPEAQKGQVETNKSYMIAQNPFLYLMSGANLAVTLRQQGKLNEVLELCENLIKDAEDKKLSNTTVVGWLQTIKAEVLAEFNNIDEAEKIALKGVATAENFKIFGVVLKCRLLLIRIYFSKGKYSEINQILQLIKDETVGFGVTGHIKSQIDSWRARMSISQSNYTEMEQWMSEYEDRKAIIFDYINENKNLAASRMYMALGRFKEAEEILSNLTIEAETNNRINALIEILVLKAQLKYQTGESELAKKLLYKAFSYAEPGGYIRTFIDEGPVIGELAKNLQRDKNSGFINSKVAVSQEYINQLCSAFSAENKKEEQAETGLSTRELEILKLIAKDYSNQQIADESFISLNTVKTHLKNINLKLEVDSRIKAVEKAKSLGIL